MNIVPPLDDRRAYMFCPLCAINGTKTELRREQHLMLCGLGHAFEYAMIQQMMKSGNPPEMIKTEIIEKPSDHAEKVGVWMAPGTWKLLQERYHGRLWVTLGTVMDALADGSIIFITGEDAKKLRDMGVKSSKDMVAMAEGSKQLEEQMKQQQAVIDKLQPILAAAGVSSSLV